MKRSHWRTVLFTTALVTTGMPLLLTTQAIATPQLIAQFFPDSWRYAGLSAGTVLPVRYEGAERIVVAPDETFAATLAVSGDLRSNQGEVLIPNGSTIEGELRPVEGGTQFFADEVIFPNGQRYSLDANSRVFTRTETVSERENPDFLRGAAIGGAAGAVLGELFGGIDIWEVVAGAGVGVLGEVLLRGSDEVEVVVVEGTDLTSLTLQSDFDPDRASSF